jgi:hypothetical protein
LQFHNHLKHKTQTQSKSTVVKGRGGGSCATPSRAGSDDESSSGDVSTCNQIGTLERNILKMKTKQAMEQDPTT